MTGFALSERWNGWSDLDVMVLAAQAAVLAGPLDPLVCEIAIEWEHAAMMLDNLDELARMLPGGAEPISLDIWIAHAVESEAGLLLAFNGRWLQINGSGSDWQRARQAYDAARVEIALAYGITTFRLPELPADTVTEVRRRRGVKDQDPGRAEKDTRGPAA